MVMTDSLGPFNALRPEERLGSCPRPGLHPGMYRGVPPSSPPAPCSSFRTLGAWPRAHAGVTVGKGSSTRYLLS